MAGFPAACLDVTDSVHICRESFSSRQPIDQESGAALTGERNPAVNFFSISRQISVKSIFTQFSRVDTIICSRVRELFKILEETTGTISCKKEKCLLILFATIWWQSSTILHATASRARGFIELSKRRSRSRPAETDPLIMLSCFGLNIPSPLLLNICIQYKWCVLSRY